MCLRYLVNTEVLTILTRSSSASSHQHVTVVTDPVRRRFNNHAQYGVSNPHEETSLTHNFVRALFVSDLDPF